MTDEPFLQPALQYFGDWAAERFVSITGADDVSAIGKDAGTVWRTPDATELKKILSPVDITDGIFQAQIRVFSLPNHLYELFWELDFESAAACANEVEQPLGTHAVEDDSFAAALKDMSDLIEHVEPKFASLDLAHIHLSHDTSEDRNVFFDADVMGQRSGRSDPVGHMPPQLCAWINVEDADQFALVVKNERDKTAPYFRFCLPGRHGILWRRDVTLIKEYFKTADAMNLKAMFLKTLVGGAATSDG